MESRLTFKRNRGWITAFSSQQIEAWMNGVNGGPVANRASLARLDIGVQRMLSGVTR